MGFPERLAALRKGKNLSQQELAKKIGISVIQINRYEAGKSQPTLDVIRNLAIALGVSADVLLFDTHERGPSEELRLQFEKVNQFGPEEMKVAKAVLESLILKHEVKKWGSS